jgi:nitroreductase
MRCEALVRWSGSASNRQHWELVVVQKCETLQALAQCEGYAKHLAGAALGIVLVMAGEPDLVDQETFDEGRLSERIMLAAEAYGVGSCIGWRRRAGEHGRESAARHSAKTPGAHDSFPWLS